MSAKNSKASLVYFADITPELLEEDKSLPVKFKRLLKKLNLKDKVRDKKVAIKMHFGGSTGYTTIHPVFLRILVQELKDCGAKSVKAMDGSAEGALARGYTREVLGCPVVSCFGESGKYYYREKIDFKKLDEVYFAGEAVDCDYFIDLSHAKGHGDCGYGGAIKNIAMGIVPDFSRWKIHDLEGFISYHKDKCTFCLKCLKTCKTGAISANREKKEIGFFWHHCTGCKHCVLACQKKALTLEKPDFYDFSRGMAIVTAKFLGKFKPENLLFINFLLNITVYCDCWGFSTPSIVPDIGILASEDIAAVETATLDMIKTENFLPNGIGKNRKLLNNNGHLFEKIHGKNPYLMIKFLKENYSCETNYRIEEIK